MSASHPNSINGRWYSGFIFSFLFIAVLLLPAIVGYSGILNPAASLQHKVKPPVLQMEAFLEPEYYHAWEDYLTRHLLALDPMTRAKRWLDYRLFNMTDSTQIHVGRDGWLFPQKDIDEIRQGACGQKERMDQLLFDVMTLDRLIEKTGRKFLFSIAPEKSTIYPEKIGRLPVDPSCRESRYDLFIAEHKEHRLKCFVRLDTLLKTAKSEHLLLYTKTGAIWNPTGAAVAAKALVNRITGKPESYLNNNEQLTRLMIDGVRQSNPKGTGNADQSPHPSTSAVVYGGSAMTAVLPDLTRLFKRVDAITTDSIPSSTYGEDISAYDTVLVIIDESQLASLQLNFDALCHGLGIEEMAESERRISFHAIAPGSRLSLEQQRSRVTIKSLGSDAFFTLSIHPGSDRKTLRILTFNMAAPNVDTLTLRSTMSPDTAVEKSLRPEGTQIYVPLPVQSKLRLRIYPGRSTGIYTLSEAKILEFKTDLIHSPAPAPSKAQAVIEKHKPLEEQVLPDTGESSTPPLYLDMISPAAIKLNDFDDMRIFQRQGNNASVMVSGTYSGHPEAVEACVFNSDNNEAVTPWQSIDTAPDNGIFLGTLNGIPQGGWYHIAVRFADTPEIKARGTARWGVGILIGCTGQSNMKEWFYAGKDNAPHPLLALYRQGQWQPMPHEGNGAIRLGNRLIEKLGIPVGLLDYAVNGSGLCKEADWGAGYWTDRSDTSIYAAFIKDVAAIGSVLEYVVWMQGEADAARGTITEDQYRNTLMSFINQQVRQDILNGSNQKNLPFLIINMPSRPIGKDEPHQAIRDALYAVTQEVENCYLAAISLDLKNLGRQHLSPEAYSTLGMRTAQTILFLLGKEYYYRGPSILEASRFGDTTIIVHITHRGGFDFLPTADISGWQALHGGESIPIAQTKRENARSVRITLGQPVTGPIILRYLYGARPDTSQAIHDNSSLTLPLEPGQLLVR